VWMRSRLSVFQFPPILDWFGLSAVSPPRDPDFSHVRIQMFYSSIIFLAIIVV
jgi:hypothetical protein